MLLFVLLSAETLIATPEQLLLHMTQFSISTRQMLNAGSPGSMSMPHSGSAPFVCMNTQLRIVTSSADMMLVPWRAWPEHRRFSRSACLTFSTYTPSPPESSIVRSRTTTFSTLCSETA